MAKISSKDKKRISSKSASKTSKASKAIKPSKDSKKDAKKSAKKAKAALKKVEEEAKRVKKAKKEVESSSSDSDSDSESEAEVKKSKADSESSPSSSVSDSDSSSSSDSDSSDDEKKKVKGKKEGKKESKKAGSKKSSKKEESSDDSSDSESSDSDSDASDKEKKEEKSEKDESSSDSSSDSSDSSDDEEEEENKESKKSASDDGSGSSNGSDSDSDSSSSGSDSDSDSSSSDSKKRKADDNEVSLKRHKKEESLDASEPATLFVGRLAWSVDDDWLKREFEPCGGVLGARVLTERATGRSRGYGYVDFESKAAAEKALAEYQGKEIDGRPINLDMSTSKSTAGQGGAAKARASKYGDTPSEPSDTLFIGNLSFQATRDELFELFGNYGSVVSVRIPTNPDTEQPKGFGYAQFSSTEEAKAALEALNGEYVSGRAIRLDYSTPKPAGERRSFGGGRGGRGGSRGGNRQSFGGRERKSFTPTGSNRAPVTAEFKGQKKTFD